VGGGAKCQKKKERMKERKNERKKERKKEREKERKRAGGEGQFKGKRRRFLSRESGVITTINPGWCASKAVFFDSFL